MTLKKKYHWLLIFTILFSFTVFSLTSLLSGNGEIKLAQAVENIQTFGPGGDVAMIILIDTPIFNKPIQRELSSKGITYCLPNISMKDTLSQTFAPYVSSYNGISAISLTNSDMQDLSVHEKLNALNSTGFICRGSRVNRIFFLSPVHVS